MKALGSFELPPSVRIYFAAELVDMRKGIDGLRGDRMG